MTYKIQKTKSILKKPMATSQKVLYIKKTHVGLIDKIMSAKNLF